jgi:hypothetical protein
MRKWTIKLLYNKYIIIYYYNITFFNFSFSLRCLRVTPGVRVPQVEYHCPRCIDCDDRMIMNDELESFRKKPSMN